MYVFGLRSLLTLFFILFSFAVHAKTTTIYFLTINSYDFATKTVQGEVCKYQANIKESSGKCLPLDHGTYKLTLFDQEGNKLNREAQIIHKGQKWTYELDASGLDIDDVEIVLQQKSSKFKKHILKTTKIKIRKHITKLKNGLRKLKSDLKRKKLSKEQFAKQSKKLHSKVNSYKEILLKLDQKIADTNEALASISFPLSSESQSSLKLGFSFENYFFNYSLPQGISTQGSRPEVELTVKNRATKNDICPDGSTDVFCQVNVGPSQIAINLTEIRPEMMAMTSFIMPAISDLTNVIFTKVGLLNLSDQLFNAFKIPFIIDQSAPSFSSDAQMIYTKEVSFSATATSSSAIDPDSLIVSRNGLDITNFATVVLSEDQLTATIEVSDPDALEGEHEYQILISNISQKQSDPYIQNVTVDRTNPVITASIGDLINLKQISLPLNITDFTLESISVSLNSELIYTGQNIDEIALNLNEGTNTVVITATDLAGNENSLTLSTTVDSIAPEITLNTPSELQKIPSTTVTLQGQVSSDSSLTINGQNVAVNSGSFSYEALSTSVYTLVAADSAGNSTTLVRNVSVNTIPTIAVTLSSDYSIAPATFSFDFSNSRDDGTLTYALYEGQTLLESSTSPIITKNYTSAIDKVLTAVITDELGEKASKEVSIALAANSAPVVNISSNTAEVYPSDPVNFSFTASDDEAVVTYSIDFGDGSTASNPQSPYTHSYSQIGSYTVTITALDRQGLSTQASTSINVIRKNVAPVANFTFDQTIKNPPFDLFVDASSSTDDDGITTYKWRVNSGEWVSSANPTTNLTIANEGNNQIDLIVTDSDGVDSEIVSKTYYANMAPTIQFSHSKDYEKAPSTVSFDFSGSADSDGSIAKYQIYNGATLLAESSDVIFSKSFDSALSENLTAVVVDNLGAKAEVTFNLSISTNTAPNTSIVASVNEVYPNDSITFTIISSDDEAVIKNTIDFGDGVEIDLTSLTVSHSFTSLGSYTVTTKAYDRQGLFSSATTSINVIRKNVAPVANFTFDQTIKNPPFDLLVDASSSTDDDGINSYKWRVNSGEWVSSSSPTTSLTIANEGNNQIELIVTDSDGVDSEIVSKTYYANMAPSIAFSVSSDYTVAPATFTFDFTGSADPDGSELSYQIYKGDELLVESQDTTFTKLFSEALSEALTAVVVDSHGAKAETSFSMTLLDNSAPNATLSASTTAIYPNESVTFVFESTDNEGVTSSSLDLGDGTIIDNPTSPYTHTYLSVGSYTASYTAFDRQNLSASSSVAITVNRKNVAPVASFSFDSTIQNPPFNLGIDASASTDDDGITSYKWRVNGADWISSETPLAELNITQAGNNQIDLVVTDSDGVDSEIVSKTYYANMPPVANFSIDKTEGIAPVTVTIDATASTDDEEVVSYRLETNNEIIENSTGQFSYEYTTDGTFEVKVSAIDRFGAVGTNSANVVVTRPEPVNHLLYSFFKYAANESSVTLNFLPFSTAPITKAWYEISDGRVINLTEFLPETKSTLEFLDSSPLTVTLHVEAGELTDSYSTTIDPSINLETLPVSIDYAVLPAGNNTVVFYLPMIYHPDLDINDSLMVTLDFGDGNTQIVNIAETPYLKYTYGQAGSYTTSATVSSPDQVAATLSKTIDVLTVMPEGMPKTIISGFKTYQLDMIGADYVTLSVDQSVSLVGDIIGYFWDLGDGTSATGKQAAHFYETGTYLITLTVVDSLGNSESIAKRIYVYDEGSDLVGGIFCNPTTLEYEVNCSIIFADKTMQINSIDFSAGDGFTATVTPENSGYMYSEVPYTFADAGTYNVTATAHTTRGESLTVTAEVALEPSNQAPVAYFDCMIDELTHQIMCDSSLSSDDKGITSYQWYINDEAISDQPLMMHEYTTGGDLTVKLILGDDLLFTELSKTYFVNDINDYPIANVQCYSEGLSVRCLSDGSYDPENGLLTYKWSSQGIELSTAQTLEYLFDSAGEKSITLEVTDDIGQSTIAQTTIKISENPEDIINLALSCEALNLFTMYCTTENTTGTVDEIHWYVDGEDVSNGKSYIEMKLSEGDHSVRVTAQNALFVEEKLTTYSIIYNEPIADFSYSLKEDGMIAFDASGSLGEGLSPYRFDWKVMDDTGYEYQSMTPYIEIDYEAVQGKEIQLTIYDLKDETATVQKIVSVESYNFAPEVSISAYGLKGKADRHVSFDASNSIDREGGLASYSWNIDGTVYDGVNVEHEFPAPGTYHVILDVTDTEGKVSSQEIDYVVEPLRLAKLKNRYTTLTPVIVSFENYILEEAPVIKINGVDADGEFVAGVGYIVITPYVTETTDTIMVSTFLDQQVEHSFEVNPIVQATFPKYEIEEELRNIRLSLVNTVENTSDAQFLLDNFDARSDYINDILNELDDGTLQLINHFISQLNVGDIYSVSLFNYLNPLFQYSPSLISSAYALNDQDVLGARTRCIYQLNRIPNKSFALTAVNFATLGLAEKLLSKASNNEEFDHAAAVLIGSAFSGVIATASVAAQLSYEYDRMLLDCKDDLLFPYVNDEDHLDLTVNITKVEGWHRVYPNQRFSINVSAPISNFYGYDRVVKEKTLNGNQFYNKLLSYEKMKDTNGATASKYLEYFDNLISTLRATKAIMQVGTTTAKLLSAIVGMELLLDHEKSSSIASDEQLKLLLEKFKDYSAPNTGYMDVFDHNSLKIIGKEVNVSLDSTEVGLNMSLSSKYIQQHFTPSKPVNELKFEYKGIVDGHFVVKIIDLLSKNYTGLDYSDSVKLNGDVNNLSILLMASCSDQKTKRYPFGGGTIADGVNVLVEQGSEVVIDSNSTVCGNGTIVGEASETKKGSYITNSIIDVKSGGEDFYIKNSTVTNVSLSGNLILDASRLVSNQMTTLEKINLSNLQLSNNSAIIINYNGVLGDFTLDSLVADNSTLNITGSIQMNEVQVTNTFFDIVDTDISVEKSSFSNGEIRGSEGVLSVYNSLFEGGEAPIKINVNEGSKVVIADSTFSSDVSLGWDYEINPDSASFISSNSVFHNFIHRGSLFVTNSNIKNSSFGSLGEGKDSLISESAIEDSQIYSSADSIYNFYPVMISNSTIKHGDIESCIIKNISLLNGSLCHRANIIDVTDEIVGGKIANVLLTGDSKLLNGATINAYPDSTVIGGEDCVTGPEKDIHCKVVDSTIDSSIVRNPSLLQNATVTNNSDIEAGAYSITNNTIISNSTIRSYLQHMVDQPVLLDNASIDSSWIEDIEITNSTINNSWLKNHALGDDFDILRKISGATLENVRMEQCNVSNSQVKDSIQVADLSEYSNVKYCDHVSDNSVIIDTRLEQGVVVENSEVHRSVASGTILSKSVIEDSSVEGTVSGATILDNSNITGAVYNSIVRGSSTVTGSVTESSIIDGESEVDSIVINSNIYSGSKVYGNSYVEGSTITNFSRVYDNAKVYNSTVSSSSIYGDAYITTSKTEASCDGVSDFDPEDPCMR